MAASCSYCGANLNFGLKFCVVCGRQTVAALNKMGGLKSGVRQGDMTKRLDDSESAQGYRSRTKSLRFRKSIRTLTQTIFYGFVVGALFFCAIRFSLQTMTRGGINRLAVPIFHPLPTSIPNLGQFGGNKTKTAAKRPLSKHKARARRTPKHQ